MLINTHTARYQIEFGIGGILTIISKHLLIIHENAELLGNALFLEKNSLNPKCLDILPLAFGKVGS